MIDDDAILADLRADEGFSSKPYRDIVGRLLNIGQVLASSKDHPA